MKMTQVMLSKGFGGAERYFVDLCLALAANGHPVQAICHPAFQQRRALENCPRLELTYVHAHGSWDRWAAHKIKQRIASFQPEIIHAHLARGTWLSSKAAVGLGIPLVVKTHNYVQLKYYHYVDRFIPTTADQERFLVTAGIPTEKITRIPNFSSLPAAAIPHTFSTATPVFTALGRFVNKKGFDVLLHAFAHYIEGGGRGRLRIGGTGQEGEKLSRLCQTLGLGQQVEFCGWIDEIRDFLRQADVFIVPSRQEPFGIVLLEAMALGLPIITTRTQGPLEILSPESAYFVEPGDIYGLAEAMKEAISHPQLTNQKAAAALERFKAQYGVEAVLPQILQLYRAAGSNY